MTMLLDEFVYDPFSPEVMSNPFPFYEVLREHFPVYYSAKYDTFFLSRFQDIWDFLRIGDNTFLSSEGVIPAEVLLRHNQGVPPPIPPLKPFAISGSYGSPVHEQVRQAHGKPLRPGATRQLEGFVRQIANERLDLLLPKGRFDLTQEYAGMVSASVICHMYRMPMTMAREVLDAVNASTRTDVNESNGIDLEAIQRLAGYIKEVVAPRRAEGPDGSWPLVDGMFELEFAGEKLDDQQIAQNLVCVLVGGTETLPKISAHGLMELWRHREQLAEVRQDLAANCGQAFEEMIRFCGPAQWFGRTAYKPVVVAGQEVKPGQRVIYLIQSAGRDPREFEQPDEFIWDRPIPRTLGFGLGQHFCIGVHLARVEGRVVIEEFLRRVADYEIDEAAAVRLPSSFQWGYNQLPVIIKQLA
jgi:cytochrome P450